MREGRSWYRSASTTVKNIIVARFLHTSDWHLGLKLRFVPGDGGAQARSARFAAVRKIGELAKAQAVDAVVVAGDIFDDNAVGSDTLQRTRDALATFAPVPVLLLPGNHDSAGAGGALERLAPAEHGLGHVEALLESTPRRCGEITVYPCPLNRRHTFEDPTAGLPDRGQGEGIRVALAHGGILDFGESTEAPNRIDAEGVLAKSFDYVALGDWHGTFHLGPRVWYSGTPEPTRFEEKEPGNVLLVEIEEAGATPRVERRSVASMRWCREQSALGCREDLDLLESRLRELPEKSSTLLELTLEGHLSLAERGRLDALLETVRGQLLFLRLHQENLALRPATDDFDRLETEGFVRRTIEELRQEGTPESEEALFLLYRLLREEAR